MAPKQKKWSELTDSQKRLIGGISVADLVAKASALRSLYKTDAKDIRGPKWLWAIIIIVVNTAGPAAFYTVGRK